MSIKTNIIIAFKTRHNFGRNKQKPFHGFSFLKKFSQQMRMDYFIGLKQGTVNSPSEIELQIIKRVKEKIGPVASFKKVVITHRLLKTRSGKILRKIIRAIVDGTKFITPSTIEDITVLDELKQLSKEQNLGILK